MRLPPPWRRTGRRRRPSTRSSRTGRGSSEAYDVDNPTTGSVTTLFRVGGLVGQVADSGTANPSELDEIITAFAAAMGDKAAAGTSAAAPTDDPLASDEPLGSDDASAEPTDAPFAPDLEALLPKSITVAAEPGASPAPISLTAISASATDAFGTDPSSRAFAARIRSLGSTFDDLQVARAIDETSTIDVVVDAFRLPKIELAKLKAAVLEAWLSAGVDGVTQTTVTLGGKSLIKVDYGDAQPSEYVYAVDDVVIVIETSDAEIATAVASQLK